MSGYGNKQNGSGPCIHKASMLVRGYTMHAPHTVLGDVKSWREIGIAIVCEKPGG